MNLRLRLFLIAVGTLILAAAVLPRLAGAQASYYTWILDEVYTDPYKSFLPPLTSRSGLTLHP